ncbi:MAG: hypothetical protein IPM51_13275 [Sphingobacteriaceae bacterium]|nr:hypothetical protein [Sphingobacteriaceae bacterium]
MKNIILITALLITGLGILKGHNGKEHESIMEKIRKNINLSEQAQGKQSSIQVNVLFKVNESGQVIEANAQTENKQVKKELEEQFLKLSFNGLKACVTNTAPIRFTIY